MPIDYDPRVEALLHPERRETVFADGTRYTRTQIAVEAARLAYYRAEDQGAQLARLQSALACAGLGGLRHFSSPLGTQAFAAYDPVQRLAVLAFRGTQVASPLDIGVNASAVLLPWRGPGRVHAGFAAAFESVREGLQQWLDSVARGRQGLVVCGHSLGAAMATLAASNWPAAELVTLGSPRVGNQAFVDALAGPALRIVHCCDLVVRLPPRLLGFAHLPGLAYVDHQGVLREAPSPDSLAHDRRQGRALYAEQAWRLGDCATRDLADHAPVNYLRAFFD